jgi:hypothetical protein
LETRIEAHIFVAFLAYCLMVTLKQRLKALAPGLTPKAVARKARRHSDDRRRTAHDGSPRRTVQVRGPAKVMCHRMFGIVVITVT